jgi:cell division protein FtsB
MIEEKTVQPGKGFNAKIMAFWMALLVIFIAQMLAYTWCRIQCVRLGYEISVQTDKYQELTAVQNKLKIEAERLKSPERIGKIATYQMGLVMPAPEQKKNIVYETH